MSSRSLSSISSSMDNLPPLWPKSPKWPFDRKLRFEVLQEAGFLSDPFKQNQIHFAVTQRKSDCAWRHLCFLATNKVVGGTASLSEWDLLFREAGFCVRLAEPHRDPTTIECTFEEASNNFFSQRNVPDDYEPPTNYDEMTNCKQCQKVCISQCGISGEMFCSRDCMKQAWGDHEPICRLAYKNGGNLTSILTQYEMKNTLSTQEMDRALGIQ